MYRMLRHCLLILLSLIGISSCSVNPVTGERQLLLLPESKDYSTGKQQYLPAQQSQGGEYVLDPALSAYVSRVGLKLAAVSDKPEYPYEFVVLNNSVPNAWALPSGKIAINRGLLTQLETESQLAAVLGHEIVHAAARHGAQRMQSGLVTQVGVAALGLGLAENDYRSLIVGGAALGAQLTMAKYGRDHELESDHFGMKYMAAAGYDLNGAVELQQLFLSMKNGQEPSWINGLFASHPPSQERLDKNRSTLLEYGGGSGYIGKEAYLNATAYIREKAPAYTLETQAKQAVKDKRFNDALKTITQAIKIEPREASFYALRGEVYSAREQNKLASRDFDKAVELNPELFSTYLKRGQHRQSLGKTEAAQQDFERSLALLPTSVAALAMGNSLAENGDYSSATSYLELAAQSTGQSGKQAKRELSDVYLKTNPSKVLKVSHFQDPKGPLLVTIENTSGKTLKSVTLNSILFNLQNQAIEQDQWTVPGPINPGTKSRYYSVPMVYHLPPNQRIKTAVVKATY